MKIVTSIFKRATFVVALILLFAACEDDPATTGTLIVNLPGYPFTEVGLYDPASVTPTLVNTSDALIIQSFNTAGKATFSNVLPGNYIVVFHENTFIRKGVQVIAGQTVNVSL